MGQIVGHVKRSTIEKMGVPEMCVLKWMCEHFKR